MLLLTVMINKEKIYEILQNFECEDDVDLDQYQEVISYTDMVDIINSINEEILPYEITSYHVEHNERYSNCIKHLEQLFERR